MHQLIPVELQILKQNCEIGQQLDKNECALLGKYL